MRQKPDYVAPSLEVLHIQVESGIAASDNDFSSQNEPGTIMRGADYEF